MPSGGVLEAGACAHRWPSRRTAEQVAAIFSMDDERALADSCLADPLKADVAAGKLGLLDAVMAQIDLNQRLDASRRAIGRRGWDRRGCDVFREPA